MKKKLIFFPILFFLYFILAFPNEAMTASKNGIVLWYEKILPVLLPFTILSNVAISSGCFDAVTGILTKILHPVFPVSQSGCFVLCSGFLFGFPMGSKNCAALLREGKISKKEGELLFLITNNISPVFIRQYILLQQLGLPNMSAQSLAIIYAPALLFGVVALHKIQPVENLKKPASGFQINFKIVDAGIMDGCETLVKIGGYIMLFSMAAAMLETLPFKSSLLLLLSNGLLEITNGIKYISTCNLTLRSKYVWAMTFAAFGGISGIAQTSSMIKGTHLSIKKYTLAKLFFAGCSFLLAVLFSTLFPFN